MSQVYLEAIFIQIIDDEQAQITLTHHNFLTQTCSSCKKKMMLSEGDMIYGDKWYHSSCWSIGERNNTEHSVSRN